MKRLLSFSLAILLLLTLSGCSLFSGDADRERPVLSTDEATYEAGGTFTLRLDNRTEENIGYNLCFASLERRAGIRWVQQSAWAEPELYCLLILYALEPGESDTFIHTLRSNLEAGTYRFKLRVELLQTDADDREFQIVSNPFTLE